MENDSELRQAISQLAHDGKASCKSLLALALKTGASPGQIGRICNEMNVRICACQLGCFK